MYNLTLVLSQYLQQKRRYVALCDYGGHFEKRAIGHNKHYKYWYFHLNTCSSLFLDLKNVYFDPDFVSISAVEVKICGIMRFWRPFWKRGVIPVWGVISLVSLDKSFSMTPRYICAKGHLCIMKWSQLWLNPPTKMVVQYLGCGLGTWDRALDLLIGSPVCYHWTSPSSPL